MPGRRLPDQPVDDSLCRQCQTVRPAVTIRNKPLCKSCFIDYAQSKIVKRLESFRVRHAKPGQEPKLLLPLSFDACSLGLLHVLSTHLKGQSEKTGRTGFRICVLHAHDEQTLDEQTKARFSGVQALYPEHEYCTVPLHEVLIDDATSTILASHSDDAAQSSEVRLLQLLQSAKTATAQQDLKEILTRRLIVLYAKKDECRAILWPDSTTRLAQRSLAETAKGRGFSVPWLVADGESLYAVQFYHPLRDLLNKEVEAYVALIEPSLSTLIKVDLKAAVNTKHTTIDDLMRQYFGSVEQEYPSIVANVVRTTGKLQLPALGEVEKQCELCEMPLENQAPVRSRLCYGCLRTLAIPQG